MNKIFCHSDVERHLQKQGINFAEMDFDRIEKERLIFKNKKEMVDVLPPKGDSFIAVPHPTQKQNYIIFRSYLPNYTAFVLHYINDQRARAEYKIIEGEKEKEKAEKEITWWIEYVYKHLT